MSKTVKKPSIKPGAEVVIYRPNERGVSPVEAVVDDVQRGLIWFKGFVSHLKPGDGVLLEHPVTGDARYVVPAEIEAAGPERFALSCADSWERLQQRAFVRIATYGIQVRVCSLYPEDPAIQRLGNKRRRPDESELWDKPCDMIDLSAGGMRFAGQCEYRENDEIECQFELPMGESFDIEGRVVRVGSDADTERRQRWVAVEFQALDDERRSQLLRWIFREQVRRHRAAKNGINR